MPATIRAAQGGSRPPGAAFDVPGPGEAPGPAAAYVRPIAYRPARNPCVAAMPWLIPGQSSG